MGRRPWYATLGDYWQKVWQPSKRYFRRASDVVTPAGWIFVVGTILGFTFGYVFGWVELVAIGFLSLTMLLLAFPFLIGKNPYLVTLGLDRDHVTAGDPVDGTLAVTNLRNRVVLPGRIGLPLGAGVNEVNVPMLGPGAEDVEVFALPTQRRGVVTVGPAHTRRGDPFGVFLRKQTWEGTYTVYVRPRITQLPTTATGLLRDLEGNPSALLVSDDLAFHAIRDYAPGDPQRQIHWKSTAKTGQLMVRQYEQTRKSQMLVALASREDEFFDEDEFELAVSVAASLGVRGIRDGRSLQFITAGQMAQFGSGVERSLNELSTRSGGALLDGLCYLELSDGVYPLVDITALAAERDQGISIVAMVVGSAATLKDLRSASLAFSPDVAVLSVICDTSAEPSFRQIGGMSVITVPVLDDLRQMLRRRARL